MFPWVDLFPWVDFMITNSFTRGAVTYGSVGMLPSVEVSGCLRGCRALWRGSRRDELTRSLDWASTVGWLGTARTGRHLATLLTAP